MKKKPNSKSRKIKDIQTNKILEYANYSVNKSLEILNTRVSGLTEEEVETRQENGLNELEVHHVKWYQHLWLSYKNPFNFLLTAIMMISVITNDVKSYSVIAIMIFIATTMRFIQEQKSSNSANRLKELVSPTVTVKRSGIVSDILVKNLVAGDIVILSAGDMIPADLRLITARDLFISQSAFTGESIPVEKFVDKNNKSSVTEASNILLMGTNVVSGIGIAIVVNIGKETVLGMLAKKVERKTTLGYFQKTINQISWLMIGFMMVIAPVVFVVHGFLAGDWQNAALFSLAIAVGLTPEMLPMIISSTFAKGAVSMAKQNVIVKRLDAIYDLGAMNVLCVDKTGTLTQNKICLEKHIDIFGESCNEVLQYAYLNSFYQTGLKNLLDVAVLDMVSHPALGLITNKYQKIDEIPFDFKRKIMSVLVEVDDKVNNKIDNHHILIAKGAVEEILVRCKYVKSGDAVNLINNEILDHIISLTDEMNSTGMRVVAVAIKDVNKTDVITSASETDLVLIGYIAFLDPPKESSEQAINALYNLGVDIKILTGDNELVATKICNEVGLKIEGVVVGEDIDKLTDAELAVFAKNNTVFAKLTPDHKERVVKAMHYNNNVVGFMGDGINDATAMRAADVAISVENGVDIAKEAADIVLLEKSLMAVERGIIEGRKTCINILKYLRVTTSSNFGNVISLLIASIILPFLPLLPVQILLQNLIYDISQIAIPFDRVDCQMLKKPIRWNSESLRQFMVFFGPISSIFDMILFATMWYVIGASNNQSLFQTGWFVESLITQALIVHIMRTPFSFIKNLSTAPLLLSTLLVIIFAISIPYTSLSQVFVMTKLPIIYFLYLFFIVGGYVALSQYLKKLYIRQFGWL